MFSFSFYVPGAFGGTESNCDGGGLSLRCGDKDDPPKRYRAGRLGPRIISYGKLGHGDSPEVDGDTLFEIGSVTKTFTALLLEGMIQQGEMNLDDPVERFLPTSYIQARDPAWGVSKRLRVEFRLAGADRSLEASEGETLALSNGAEVVTHRSGLLRDLKDNSEAGLYDTITTARLPREPGHKVE